MGSGKEVGEPSHDIHYPINIGNPTEFTVIELAERVIALTGGKSAIQHEPLPVDDPRVRQPDITRARKLLGWAPEVALQEGLTRTIEYFRSIGETRFEVA